MQWTLTKLNNVIAVLLVFGFISSLLTFQIDVTSKYLVDEFFHIPQGVAYCNQEYSTWDPKITTLPGLYIFSSLFCTPFGKCSSLCLRLSNIAAGCLNIIFFVMIRNRLAPHENFHKTLMTAVNIAILPPLFFLTHIYYTDVASLTSVLALVYFGLNGQSYVAASFGLISFVFRQTNIIYLGFVMGLQGLKHLDAIFHKLHGKIVKDQRFKDNKQLMQSKEGIIKMIQTIMIHLPSIFAELAPYLVVIFIFISFILYNDGIVVGDKQAHLLTLHVPQLFYFALFTLFFSWPHYLRYIKPFVAYIRNNSMKTLLYILIIAQFVYLNTSVHPYLLADNRHYTFYLWKNFFNTDLKRVGWTAVYFFALFSIFCISCYSRHTHFITMFIPTLFLALCLQKLVDVRYFLPPYVLLRLYYGQSSWKILSAETLTHLLLNIITYRIFFTREVFWEDYDEAQRIMW